jgi:hypothetical protein
MLLRWLSVQRRSQSRQRRLRQGLITVQGAMRAPITPAIMRGGISLIATIGTSPAHRDLSAAWR